MVDIKKEIAQESNVEVKTESRFLDYKILIVQVRRNSEIKKLETQVNEYIAKGYEPYGDLQFDHCSEGCMDAVQVMVQYKEK